MGRLTDVISIPVDDLQSEPVAPVPTDMFLRHVPLAHLQAIAGKSQVVVARCSIWLVASHSFIDEWIGAIGHFAAAPGQHAAAVRLLDEAVVRLRSLRVSRVVGPMDGNTWRRYRLVTDRGIEPPFLLEPENPPEWVDHFEAAGFAPLARYHSALNEDLSVTDPRVPPTLERLASVGIRLRAIDLSRLHEELAAVHELSLAAFASNLLYTPIDRDEFIGTYAAMKQHLQPELILMAQDATGRLIGFMFGYPDLAQAQRGEQVNTAIAKTVAVRPGRTGAGLGSVLVDRFQQAARAAGYTRVIHALMHENNISMRISNRFGRPIRRYTLYGKMLST